jgi:hypothetical protein
MSLEVKMRLGRAADTTGPGRSLQPGLVVGTGIEDERANRAGAIGQWPSATRSQMLKTAGSPARHSSLSKTL